MKTRTLKNKLGQNTAEYMLLLLLIGGASIAAFKTFGAGILNRFASVTSIITGGDEKAMSTDKIKDESNTKVDFKAFEENGKKEN